MKVGNDNSGVAAEGDIFARMEQAHSEAVSASVDQTKDSAAAGAADAQPAAGGPLPGAGLDSAKLALQERLVETASRALAGDFDSSDELREAVLDTIVEERYADKVPDRQLDQIRATLQVTLADDPVFRAEVDNMLLLAARELARRPD